jgi:ABC-type phosphate transport system substrate-binding protein
MKVLNKILVIAAICLSHVCAAEVIVIVNSANNDVIDNKLIKKIYLGKAKSFPNGNKVKVYSLTSSQADTEYFRSKALKKSNSQFKSYWSKLAFTGKGKPATELGSAAELIDAIKKDPNAIGFINSKDESTEVKTLASY